MNLPQRVYTKDAHIEEIDACVPECITHRVNQGEKRA